MFLFLLYLLLCVYFANAKAISHDEPFSIFRALLSFDQLFDRLVSSWQGPIFELILHFWIKLFGISELSVRFLPMVFSSLSLVVLYQLTRDFFDVKVALLSCAMFFFSNYQFYHAHNARPYSLWGLLIVCSLYALLNIIKKPQEQKYVVQLMVIDFLMLSTHYISAIVILFQVVYFLMQKTTFRFTRAVKITCLAIGGILVAFFTKGFFLVSLKGVLKGGTLSSAPGIDGIYNGVVLFSNAPVIAVVLLISIVMGALKWLFFADRKQSQIYAGIVLYWFLGMYLFQFCVSQFIPVFQPRYLMPFSFTFMVAGSASLLYILEKSKDWVKWVAVFSVSVAMLVTFNPTQNQRDTKFIVDKVKELNNNNYVVIVKPHFHFKVFAYHYDKRYLKDVSKTLALLKEDEIFPVTSHHELVSICEDLPKGKKVMLLDYANRIKEGDEYLSRKFDRKEEYSTHHISLYVYQ